MVCGACEPPVNGAKQKWKMSLLSTSLHWLVERSVSIFPLQVQPDNRTPMRRVFGLIQPRIIQMKQLALLRGVSPTVTCRVKM
jgi:hypothetical protein